MSFGPVSAMSHVQQPHYINASHFFTYFVNYKQLGILHRFTPWNSIPFYTVFLRHRDRPTAIMAKTQSAYPADADGFFRWMEGTILAKLCAKKNAHGSLHSL